MKTTNRLDEWMSRGDWLRGAARVRMQEAMRWPEESLERLAQMRAAAELERRAGEMA